jgi:outer membrane protein OmpA-like peptidoglycan-associated protein
MKAFKLLVSALLITLSLSACHSTKKIADNSEPFQTLRAELNPAAAVLRIADTIKVIYPELAMFDIGQDQVKEGIKPAFTRFATILRNNPNIRILINGYTDNVGNEEANVDLSKRRAATAFRLLTDYGVDATRISLAAHGPHNPMRSNTTEEGRAANRRVEFMLYPAKS